MPEYLQRNNVRTEFVFKYSNIVLSGRVNMWTIGKMSKTVEADRYMGLHRSIFSTFSVFLIFHINKIRRPQKLQNWEGEKKVKEKRAQSSQERSGIKTGV